MILFTSLFFGEIIRDGICVHILEIFQSFSEDDFPPPLSYYKVMNVLF